MDRVTLSYVMKHTLQKPTSRTIPALLDEIARAQPDHEALVDEDRRWTYQQLVSQTRDIAKSLLQLGVVHGDRVGILAGNRAEWLLTHFAITSVGAISVGLNTWATAPELAYQLKHAGIRHLFVEPRFKDRDFLALIATACADFEDQNDSIDIVTFTHETFTNVLPWGEFLASGAKVSEQSLDDAIAQVSATDLACMLYTSGSTALPKGVPLRHHGLIDNMWEIGERQHLNTNDRLWLAVSLFWSFASVNALFALITHRATIVLQHHFQATEALALISKEQCTVIYATPNMVQALTEEQSDANEQLATLRTGLTLGTPIQIKAVSELGVAEICNIYGLTEAYGNTTVTDSKLPLELRVRSVGQVLPGQEIIIADPVTGDPVGPMNTGEIRIRGNVTPAYWQAPEQNATAFTNDGWFCTGDLGYLDGDGFLFYRGRLKEMIKSGGINVSPAEVEQVLVQHTAVELAFVTGIPDEHLDEKVAAVIVTKARHKVTQEELADHCRQTLASYKTPREFRFVQVAEIPLTSTGKLQRNRLVELF